MADHATQPRPERILLVLVRSEGECRGKAIHLTNSSERQFTSIEELSEWLRGRGEADAEERS